jgi:hypothetical protein
MAPPTPSSHRPRKKRKFPINPGSNNNLILDNGDGKQEPTFPLVSFLWAARAGVSQWLILPLILMAVGLFRWAVSLWGYSGSHIASSVMRLNHGSHLPRIPGAPDARRLRGSKALDGNYSAPTYGQVVSLRLAVLGPRLPPIDRIPQLVVRQDVCTPSCVEDALANLKEWYRY